MTAAKTSLALLLPVVMTTATNVALADEPPNDATINYWVGEALQQDPRIDASRIEETTRQGVVTLSGEVRNLAARKYAVREAEKIAGVQGVIDELAVKPAHRFDSDVAGDVLWRIVNDPSINSHDVDVKVVDGDVTLRGKVASWSEHQEATLVASEVRGVRKVDNELLVEYPAKRSDDAIRADVVAAIRRDVYLAELPITVTVDNGVVTLAGTVGSAYEKERASEDARWIANVKSVKNDLEIEWWEDQGARKRAPLPSDAQIAKDVRDELYQDLRVEEPFNIHATSSYGEVTLRGSVPSYYQKRLAARDARDVVGVGWVDNELLVKSQWRDDEAIRTDILSRFKSDYLLNGQDISVRVKDGIVTLSGDTNTYDERNHAVDVASRVPGVIDVRDDINVNWFFRYTDAKLRQRIQDRLKHQADTRWVAGRIDVSVKDGVVTLSGDVFDWAERKEAGRIAMLTDGVQAVDNKVTVEGVSYPWDQWHYPTTAGIPDYGYYNPGLE